MVASRLDQTMLQAALSYAACGEPVLPLWWTDSGGNCQCNRPDGKCKPGKHPLTDNGFYDATTDPATIQGWLRTWPHANLGARTNRRPRIDVDLAEVASAFSQDASLPLQTRVASTPHDGLHVAFAVQGPLRSRVLYLRDGRRLGELKADDAYVVVPPSKIGRRSYVLLSSPGTPLLPADPLAWLARVLPEFAFELDANRSAGKRDYEALAGEIYEGEGRHNALVSYAGKVWIEGMASETLVDLLRVINQRHCRAPLPDDELRDIAEHFIRRRTPRSSPGHSSPASSSELGIDSEVRRPTIIVTNRHLRDLAAEGWSALLLQNEPPRLFLHGSGVAEIASQVGALAIAHVSAPGFRGRLDRAADWVRLKEGMQLPAKPPDDVVEDMLALEKPLPVLRGITGTPTFAKDGSLCTDAGYQPATKLFYVPTGEEVPCVPAQPDETDLLRAKQIIGLEWLGDFPFVDDASRTNAISLLLTTTARELIDGPTPLFGVDAPESGTGKGLLATGFGVIVEGREPAIMTETHDEEEMRKRITSLLLKGRPLIQLDNVQRPIDSGTFAGLLTSVTWSDRVLGVNQSVELPNRAVWLVTGNNLRLNNEIARRTIWVRLDAKSDRPWLRTGFRHPDLTDWVRRHRHELLWAFLVLVQNWLALGRPAWSGRPLGSFEAWCSVVGGILEAAGIPGFLSNREELYRRADQETEEWRAFTERWWQEMGDRPTTTAELFPLAQELLPGVFGLRDALASERALKTRLGNALRSRLDRRFGDLFLRSAGQDAHTKAALWRLEPAAEAPDPAEPNCSSFSTSAELPHENEPFSDSVADVAVLAVPDRRSSIDFSEAKELAQAGGKQVPQLPQVPQPDSKRPPDPAEPLRNPQSPMEEVPRSDHPSLACSECEGPSVDDSTLCQRHLRGLALVALDRKRWPRLKLNGQAIGGDAWRPWLREATGSELRQLLAALGVSEVWP